MVVFPNAKINLGLNIIKKRPDGYHELETCFYPVQWQEALEIKESETTVVTTSGLCIRDNGDNIVLKAYQLLKSEFDLPAVQIHVHKAIPIVAGLGGGSADAAFTLSLLNNHFSLGLSDDQLINYAVNLGADCAFFIKNRPMLAAGIGEQLSEVSISLTGKFVQLVYPNIHITTKEAYFRVNPQIPSMRIKDILEQHELVDWKDYLVNDFEESLFARHQILNDLKSNFYDSGAIYASMSGSGSCIYGIFDNDPGMVFPKEYQVWSGLL